MSPGSSYRLGGYILKNDEAIKWGERLANGSEKEVDFEVAFKHILIYLAKCGVAISVVPYPANDHVLMVVTKRARHFGWRRGDDPRTLKQFELGRVEAFARQALINDGVENFQFVTSYGRLFGRRR
ncbi:hypothetical protein FPV67DRAFT_1669870 [Lyophyllum atratum]|nr:hypothetical protein FPV67DRAFT_1669870 [Lyophyllum atratum]